MLTAFAIVMAFCVGSIFGMVCVLAGSKPAHTLTNDALTVVKQAQADMQELIQANYDLAEMNEALLRATPAEVDFGRPQ